VAHVYTPSYSGGRDQEDVGLKPALGKLVRETLSQKKKKKRKEKNHKNRAGGMAQVVRMPT
jgi:hypothetical protein